MTAGQVRWVVLMPLLTASCAAFLSCAPAGRAPSLPPTQRTQPRVDAASLEQRIHRLINREREKHGLARIDWNEALSRIARGHSRDMAKRDYFSHDSPEGQDFSARYRQAGFSCALRSGMTIYAGGENIFQNNLYDSVTTAGDRKYYDWNTEERIAETTVQGWMASPGHRKNILTPHWRTEGIGVHIGPAEKVYITQNFC